MTVTTDAGERLAAPPTAPPRRVPWRLLLLAVITLGAVGLLAGAGLQGNVVYYKTTSELVADPALHGQRLRLGGLVLPSSVQFDGAGVSFVLSDGVQDVPVVNTGQPRGVFQEGQGALVEGVWDADGVFRSDLLLVKHSNEYRAPESGLPERPPDGRS
ncbi:MAG: cytochrome c maturation protein CcmE [Mycobacteriales bacterium]